MERLHLYKYASETVEKLRTRKREEHSDARKERRNKILNLKRLRYERDGLEHDPLELTVEDVISLSRIVSSRHSTSSLQSLKSLKKAFTQDSSFADLFVVQDGALDALVKYLTGHDVEVQIEAAQCLTNLTGSTRDHAVRIAKTSGAYLITYLRSSNVMLQDLCAWSLGNIAGDCEECRCIIMDQGAVHPLVNLLKSSFPNVIYSAAFAINNLTHSNSDRAFDELASRDIAGILVKLLGRPSAVATGDHGNELTDDVLRELSTSLVFLTACEKRVRYATSRGITVPFILEILSRHTNVDESVAIVTPLVRTLGNTCASSSYQLRDEDEASLMRMMTSLLASRTHHVRKESLWLLSNVTAGSRIEAAAQGDTLHVLLVMLNESYDLRKEAAIVLLNVAHSGDECLHRIVTFGGVHRFLELLKCRDDELRLMALQFVEMVLRRVPDGLEMIRGYGGGVILDTLNYSDNNEISHCANDLINTYFEHESGT